MSKKPKIDDTEFTKIFEEHGPEHLAQILQQHPRHIYRRRRSIEKAYGKTITTPNQLQTRKTFLPPTDISARIPLEIKNGVVLVGSDAHYWPNRVSTAHLAFVKFCKDLKPNVVIMNGDVFDGASVSRHSPIGWEDRPTLIEEIDACKERLEEIRTAAPKKSIKIWTLGNHDARFETRLATVAPQYALVEGVHLKDHFPWWETAWSVWVNDDVVIKHRYKGGIHATHNNTVNSGRSIITGHLHSLKITPFTDYNGTRFGVDTGTLAQPGGPQFIDYLEDNPTNWRSGFIVLTFKDSRMLWPEIVSVFDPDKDLVEFRGEIISV
jgi:hypothetical protein